MPLEKVENNTNGSLGIWSLTEPSEELIKLCSLSHSDQKKLSNFKAERRKREFLASRILLQDLTQRKQEIIYNGVGKPALKNNTTNISISHSADFACVFISEKKIGIDVEQTTRSTERIAKRFLHPTEQEYISSIEKQQEARIIYWAAKEAIFKCTDNQGIEFNQQILIEPFQIKTEGTFNGNLNLFTKKVNFQLHYRLFKNNAFVYCVEQ